VARRLITRGLALVPAVVVLSLYGASGAMQLLVLSQVVLSLQLPFAVAPLIRFTSHPGIMGGFVNPPWMRLAAWAAAAGIVLLNIWLIAQTLSRWFAGMPGGHGLLESAVLGIGAALLALLLWISTRPLTRRR
jgi:manganese transport protein